MLWIWTLVGLALADPSSLIGERTGQAFRGPLDRAVLPASQGGIDAHEVHTLLSFRSQLPRFSGAWAGPVGPEAGMVVFGSILSSSNRVSSGLAEEGIIESRRSLTWEGSVGWGKKLRGGPWFGFRLFGEGSSSRNSGSNGGGDAQRIGALGGPEQWSRVRDATVGGSFGLRRTRSDGWLEVDLDLTWSRARSIVRQEGSAAVFGAQSGYAASPEAGLQDFLQRNREVWRAGLRIERVRRRDQPVGSRVLAELGAGGGQPPPPGKAGELVEAGDRFHSSTLAVADLRVLGLAEIRWDQLELRLGGEFSVNYQYFQGDLGPDPDAVRRLADQQGRVRLAVPVALEAIVHPKVRLFAAASVQLLLWGTWSTEPYDVLVGPNPGTFALSQYTLGGASLGTRWRPLSRLEVTSFLGLNGGGGGSFGPVLTAQSTSVNFLNSMSVALSLVLHLGGRDDAR